MTAVARARPAPITTAAQVFVHPTVGNDLNDGLSWLTPLATLTAAKALVDANGFGDVYLAAGQVYDLSSSLEVRQSMRIHGARGQISSGGGSVIRYTGPDDGSSVIRTAKDPSGGNFPDWSYGLIEGVLITSQNTLTTGWGINLRNAQNLATLRDVRIGASATLGTHGFGDGGIQFTDDVGGTDHAYPGFIYLEHVWVIGGKKAFKVTSGFTTILFQMCGVDGDAATMTDAVSIEQGNGIARSRDLSCQFVGFKYEGKGSDANAFHISVDADVQIIGGVVKNQTTLTKSAILWDATPASANDVGIPLVVDSLNSQGFPTWLSAPNLTTPITIGVPVTSAGEVYRRSYHGQMIPPAAWDGTHHALVADALTVNPLTAAQMGILINPAVGQAADMLGIAGVTASDAYTRADSTTTIGSADVGGAYAAQRGTWGIKTNKAYLATSTDDACVVLDPGVANGTLTCDITLNSVLASAFPGIVVRNTAVGDTLIVRLKGSTQELLLLKQVAGLQTTLATLDVMGYVAGSTYAMRVVLAGNTIEVWLNGGKKITYTLTGGDITAFGSATKIGYRVNGLTDNGANGSRFDNLRFVSTVTRFDSAGRLVLGGVIITYGSAAPTTGAHVVGEQVLNTAPAAGGNVGWVCVAAGTPGTWKTFGAVAA